MKRCPHQNAILVEEIKAEGVWELRDGRPVDDGIVRGESPTGAFSVRCLDCGREKRFLRWGPPPRSPLWAWRLYEAVREYSQQEHPTDV